MTGVMWRDTEAARDWGEVDAAQADAHLGWLSDEAPDARGMLWGKPRDGAAATTFTAPFSSLRAGLLAPKGGGLDAAVNEPASNVYVGLGVLARPLGVHERARSNRGDVTWLPSIFLDIDCKPGGFDSPAAAHGVVDFLRGAGLTIGLVVETGSGGLHAYGRPRGGLAPVAYREAVLRVRALVHAEFGVLLDNVSDPERVGRLAGTVRWRKKGEEALGVALWAPVRALEPRDEWLDLAVLWEVTQAPYEAAHAAAARLRSQALAAESAEFDTDETVRAAKAEIARLRAEGREAGWPLLATAYGSARGAGDVLAAFDSVVSWPGILGPCGWVVTAEADRDGRVQWQRPSCGVGDVPNPRSATTGYGSEPGGALSLLSTNAATGLQGLVLAGLKITRARCAAALYTDGDLNALLRRWDALGRPESLEALDDRP